MEDQASDGVGGKNSLSTKGFFYGLGNERVFKRGGVDLNPLINTTEHSSGSEKMELASSEKKANQRKELILRGIL